MCGIVAIVTDPAQSGLASGQFDLRAAIETMTDTIVHRGPDDSGLALFPTDGVALGMRRLSILDISGGHQPMWDQEKRICVVFNGEIYNFAELRRQLTAAGHHFVTDHSDTEVIVHGFKQWGNGLFLRLHGMFAVAIWDTAHRRLTVARDRPGEKPLYLAPIPGGYAIASEMKALLTLDGVDRAIDPTALEQYLAFDFTVGPRTLLRGVHKLPAGHLATITATDCAIEPYWTLPVGVAGVDERPGHEVLRRLDHLLDHATSSMMVADVPVGLFLSGGLDSTTVGYYMRRHSDQVHSFSIGFEDPQFDESSYAQMAATALGTNHHREVFSEKRVRDLVPGVVDILDEPMGDQSVFPTYLLSTFTRRHVKVALGGDGSDEQLMGYRTYQALKVGWTLDAVPAAVRGPLAATARHLPDRLGPVRLVGKRFAERLDVPPVHRLLSYLGSFHGDARWVLAPEIAAQLPPSVFSEPAGLLVNGHHGSSAAEQVMAAYMRGYLQEDILVKVDRASMATSLEVRSPFLDVDVLDFLATVPPALKMRGLTRKYLLRRLMHGRIPEPIISRPKKGFGVPLDSWLRRSLAPLVREYLDPERVRREGVFATEAVQNLVETHLSGRANRGHELWLLLQFQMWRERWRV